MRFYKFKISVSESNSCHYAKSDEKKIYPGSEIQKKLEGRGKADTMKILMEYDDDYNDDDHHVLYAPL